MLSKNENLDNLHCNNNGDDATKIININSEHKELAQTMQNTGFGGLSRSNGFSSLIAKHDSNEQTDADLKEKYFESKT